MRANHVDNYRMNYTITFSNKPNKSYLFQFRTIARWHSSDWRNVANKPNDLFTTMVTWKKTGKTKPMRAYAVGVRDSTSDHLHWFAPLKWWTDDKSTVSGYTCDSVDVALYTNRGQRMQDRMPCWCNYTLNLPGKSRLVYCRQLSFKLIDGCLDWCCISEAAVKNLAMATNWFLNDRWSYCTIHEEEKLVCHFSFLQNHGPWFWWFEAHPSPTDELQQALKHPSATRHRCSGCHQSAVILP